MFFYPNALETFSPSLCHNQAFHRNAVDGNSDLNCHFVSLWLPMWVSAREESEKVFQTYVSRLYEICTFLHLHLLNVPFAVFKYATSVLPATLWTMSMVSRSGLRMYQAYDSHQITSWLLIRSEASNFMLGELKTKDNLIPFQLNSNCCL